MPQKLPKNVKAILFSCLLIAFFFFSVLHQAVAIDTPANAFVSANGTKLYLNDEEYQFTGVNAFNLATYPGSNAGCGGYVTNLDTFFSTLRPNSMVRMWAFQGTMATNVTTKQIDWTGLDRVVNAAQKNGKKLILVLTEQGGQCDDGHWKDLSWYKGGYQNAYNDLGNGLTPLPYLEYVKLVVSRYKDSPAVAMWEPINEPIAADCVNGKGYECYSKIVCGNEAEDTKALRSFFDTVGGMIKSIDQKHLISSGMNGDGQCGAVYENYKYVHESPGLDVASYHDYYKDDQPMPGDPWNGLQKRIDQMKLINKPLIIGEVGMLAISGGGSCKTLTQRRDLIKAKMDAQYTAGVAGILPWSLTLGNSSGCNYDIVRDDPLVSLLRDYPVKMSSVVPSVTASYFPTPTPIPADTTPPTAPTLSASNITSSQVTLSWNGATDNKAIERYEIFKDWQYVTATTGTSYTVTGLTSGTKYLFYVKTKDTSANYSDLSNQVTITTSGSTPTGTADTMPPSIPGGLTATPISTTQIALKWNPSTDNVKVDRYEVYKDYQYVTAVWGTTYTVSNLLPGKTYSFYLKARDTASNSSAASSIVKATTYYSGPTPTPTNMPIPTPTQTPDTLSPSAPTNLIATPTSTSVNLRWTAAIDNVGIDRYEVYRDYQYINIAWGTNFTDTNLTPGKTYKYYLKSRDKAGNSSGMSSIVTVTTLL